MGMLEYAKGLTENPAVCDLSREGLLPGRDIYINAHLLVKGIVSKGGDAVDFFRQNLPALQGKIIIGDEVGSGVVPVDPTERAWRDEVGRVYQMLAANASSVTRLWAGLPQALKREGR
jgi:adenosylcobinamide kinase/adenosylcobinamide-phosphate guanylyltransferase